MLMDTGSSLSWMQCKPCVIYCHSQADPVFDPSASSTYSKLSCATPECSSLKAATLNDPACEADSNACIYTASYGDASYSIGYLGKDVLNLSPAAGSGSQQRFTFGCGQDNQGLFGRAAGILGLARTCFKGKLSEMAAAVPRVGLVFRGGAGLDLLPRNLLVEVPEDGITCLGFAKSPTIAIIANRQQQTVNVAYDVANSRIGFAPGGCH
ncbi:unnamed protein product [Linum tenue]|uniref:Peptidase A1 domain-containing protein n=1 Tax=Linum tenue TaxID=586396 RepID=A0AAV0GMG6_9ROSI|nr:unnamed protein product [Linum tenue]